MGSWKAGSPTSNPLLLKAQSRQLFIGLQQSHVTTESTINQHPAVQVLDTITVLDVTNLGDHNCLQTLCFSAWDWFFSVAATKGWAWCNHNAELVERTVALRNLSDILMSWMSLQEKKIRNGFLKPTNMSQKFPFGSASHLENIGSWKAGSPASNPLWLKT